MSQPVEDLGKLVKSSLSISKQAPSETTTQAVAPSSQQAGHSKSLDSDNFLGEWLQNGNKKPPSVVPARNRNRGVIGFPDFPDMWDGLQEKTIFWHRVPPSKLSKTETKKERKQKAEIVQWQRMERQWKREAVNQMVTTAASKKSSKKAKAIKGPRSRRRGKLSRRKLTGLTKELSSMQL
eukprot:Nitzschia sp. Nitz4//NODE_293_length_29386_cov_71.949235//12178//12717//NITZ4_additional_000034-RA//1//CDS//3329531824//5910//frame0